jgi:hypothetical protein
MFRRYISRLVRFKIKPKFNSNLEFLSLRKEKDINFLAIKYRNKLDAILDLKKDVFSLQ